LFCFFHAPAPPAMYTLSLHDALPISLGGEPPLVPSRLYVENGAGDAPQVVAGYEVQSRGYDVQGDERYFASFKRGIAARSRPLARVIDGAEWDEARAGEAFLRAVLAAVREQEGGIDELIFTVPVQSFERYLQWLRDETALVG